MPACPPASLCTYSNPYLHIHPSICTNPRKQRYLRSQTLRGSGGGSFQSQPSLTAEDGGWDHHKGVENALAGKFESLSEALRFALVREECPWQYLLRLCGLELFCGRAALFHHALGRVVLEVQANHQL